MKAKNGNKIKLIREVCYGVCLRISEDNRKHNLKCSQ